MECLCQADETRKLQNMKAPLWPEFLARIKCRQQVRSSAVRVALRQNRITRPRMKDRNVSF